MDNYNTYIYILENFIKNGTHILSTNDTIRDSQNYNGRKWVI